MIMNKKRVPYEEQREFVVRKMLPHMKEGNTWAIVAEKAGLKLEVRADKPGGVAKEKTGEQRALEMVDYVITTSRKRAKLESCKIPEKLWILADALEEAAARVTTIDDAGVDDLLAEFGIDPNNLPEVKISE